jgi:diguanylate cyclase (GGDEF)-like protein
VDAEVRREKKRLKELNTQKELARRDELTGIKNKNAYQELVASIQDSLDNGSECAPFAFVVCDANNLKKINDTRGHAAGDEYLKAASQFLCGIFVHSPVFRVGGDEFVVYLRGSDYSQRQSLVDKLRSMALENQKAGEGVVLALGLSVYDPGSDKLVHDVFVRADREMYENKRMLKGE